MVVLFAAAGSRWIVVAANVSNGCKADTKRLREAWVGPGPLLNDECFFVAQLPASETRPPAIELPRVSDDKRVRIRRSASERSRLNRFAERDTCSAFPGPCKPTRDGFSHEMKVDFSFSWRKSVANDESTMRREISDADWNAVGSPFDCRRDDNVCSGGPSLVCGVHGLLPVPLFSLRPIWLPNC